MTVGLAGFDLSDPTDRAVARRFGEALRRRGLRTRVFGPGRPGPAARGVDTWHLHLFGRAPSGFLSAAERGRWTVATTLHLLLPDYLPFAGGPRTLERLARLGPVAAVSDAQRREAERLAPSLRGRPLLVSACGPSLPEAPRRRRKAGQTLLCSARLAPYKGIDVLLLAFARLQEEVRGARLQLAGRDKSGGALRSFARRLGLGRSVEFLGELSPRALAERLAAADAFVLPSRRENFPIALLEAMAAGKACVATRAGGIPELAGRAALLVPPGDPAALTRALGRVLADPALRRSLGLAARRRAARYSWDGAAAAYERLYRMRP